MLSVRFFAVGKTSLITRFMYDSFDTIYQVSCDFMLVFQFHIFATNICHRILFCIFIHSFVL